MQKIATVSNPRLPIAVEGMTKPKPQVNNNKPGDK